jgi:hypothetical protein
MAVRAAWYPWVLLLLLQLLMPSVSFVGHVSGLLTGLAFVYNLLSWLTLAPRTISYVEAHWARRMPSVTESSTFVQYQEAKSSLPFVTPHASAGSAPPHSVLPWARADSAAATAASSSSSSSSDGLTGCVSNPSLSSIARFAFFLTAGTAPHVVDCPMLLGATDSEVYLNLKLKPTRRGRALEGTMRAKGAGRYNGSEVPLDGPPEHAC